MIDIACQGIPQWIRKKQDKIVQAFPSHCPTVMGDLRTVSTAKEKYLKKAGTTISVELLLKTALLGTTHIDLLRRYYSYMYRIALGEC